MGALSRGSSKDRNKETADGIEPFIYSQSGSFPAAFCIFFFLPCTHTLHFSYYITAPKIIAELK